MDKSHLTSVPTHGHVVRDICSHRFKPENSDNCRIITKNCMVIMRAHREDCVCYSLVGRFAS